MQGNGEIRGITRLTGKEGERMDYLLTTEGVTKKYGSQRAVDNVTLHVKQGEIYGLIGKNGAGKTTLLKMIGGLADASEGTITFFGVSEGKSSLLKKRIGVLIEAPGLYPHMTAAENLRLKCLALGVRDKQVIPELLQTVGLEDVGRKRVGRFSLGMKQRLGIALALVGNPDLILLDEPINGLDPQGIVQVRELLERLNRKKGVTFIISSHILEELSKIASSYGFLHEGQLKEEISAQELADKCGEHIEVVTENNEKACTVLEKMGIHNYRVAGEGQIQIFERLDASGEIVLQLTEHGVTLHSITQKNEALEDYYFQLIEGKGDERHV